MTNPIDMPTAHQCAIAIVTAARALGDDPVAVISGEYGCASRYYAFGALKMAFPGAHNETLGRCVGARTPYAVSAGLINLRKKPWWRQDALDAAIDALRKTGAPFRVGAPSPKGNAMLPEATVLKRQHVVLTAMRAMANARGEVHASYDSISKKCGLTGGVVAAAIKNLITKRDVTVIKPGEPRDPATYRVSTIAPAPVVPLIAASPAPVAPPGRALVLTVPPKPTPPVRISYEAQVLANYVRARPVRNPPRGEPVEHSFKGDPPPRLSALFNRPPAPPKSEPYLAPVVIVTDNELTCEYDEPIRGDESPAG